MIEKTKSVYEFENADEVNETLSSNQRPYQYDFLDPETNPLMIFGLRKVNHEIGAIVDRIDAIEKSQKDIRDALGLIFNQSHLRQYSLIKVDIISIRSNFTDSVITNCILCSKNVSPIYLDDSIKAHHHLERMFTQHTLSESLSMIISL